ncbi:MAG: hypothetical protein AABW88_03640 [Nanoarchaeota archaeon]
MKKLENLMFQAPSIIDSRLSQIKARVDDGYLPYVIVTKPVAKEDVQKFLKYVKKNNINISFEIGNCFGRPLETSIMLLNIVDSIRKQAPEQISRGIKIKCDPAIIYLGNSILMPSIGCSQYEGVYCKTISAMKQLHKKSQKLGIILEVENRARPMYTEIGVNAVYLDQKTADPNIRWGGKCSALPKFEAGIFSDAKEIVNFIGQFENTKLQLDIEHLGQTAQYGNIFTLANAKNGILKTGDLNAEQREILRTYGIDIKNNSILFDYSKMTRKEITFLKRFGYTLRENQPMVYERKVTLKGELEEIRKNKLQVSTITPGFQVYQGIFDVQNGKETLTISSHLPGITEMYIKNATIRNSLADKLKPVHALTLDFMKKSVINVVELEPHINNGKKSVFYGHSWSEQTKEMVRQLKENFELAEQGKISTSKGPFYLK